MWIFDNVDKPVLDELEHLTGSVRVGAVAQIIDPADYQTRIVVLKIRVGSGCNRAARTCSAERRIRNVTILRAAADSRRPRSERRPTLGNPRTYRFPVAPGCRLPRTSAIRLLTTCSGNVTRDGVRGFPHC